MASAWGRSWGAAWGLAWGGLRPDDSVVGSALGGSVIVVPRRKKKPKQEPPFEEVVSKEKFTVAKKPPISLTSKIAASLVVEKPVSVAKAAEVGKKKKLSVMQIALLDDI